MSSQGPAVSGSVSYNGFAADPASGSPVSVGYAFDKDSIRDSSDWIAYKKQSLLSKENQTKLKKALPDLAYSNDYRLQVLLGRFKNPTTASCSSCTIGQEALFNKRVSDNTVPN